MPISVHTTQQSNYFNQTFILSAYNEKDIHSLTPFFEPVALKQENLITHTAHGRGTVYFFQFKQVKAVLRHYYRGGLIARFNKDRFIYYGLKQTRVFQELNMLDYLISRGVQVPRPLAGRVQQHGMLYRADILTEVVEDASELHQLLLRNVVDDKIWEELGKQVALMHNAQACHDDINVKNVLVGQEGEITLIDFDACKIKQGNKWKLSNLDRLKRSINKQKSLNTAYHFSEEQWLCFLNTYKEFAQNKA